MFFKVIIKNCSLIYYQRQRALPKLGKYGTVFTGAFTLFFSKSPLQLEAKNFMAPPLTPIKKLEKILLDDPDDIKARVELMIMRVQANLCHALENEDDCSKFIINKWTRKDAGGGVTCVLQDGKVFEKAAVNISLYFGNLPREAAVQLRKSGKTFKEEKLRFFTAGFSCEIHPKNPMVPSVHCNYQYFEVQDGSKAHWWFKGCSDLTPYYFNVADAVHFHTTLKNVCDKHDKSYYFKFKKWCDDHFYIAHRGESRGVGGIYFDDLDTPDAESCLQFICDCANSIVASYIPLIQRHKHAIYTKEEKKWQLFRRGRYVEFNLLYDKDMKFELYTPGANFESIFSTLPLQAQWEYRYQPSPKSPEGELLEVLRNPRDWIEQCSCSDHQKN